jgi:hypothetical protein
MVVARVSGSTVAGPETAESDLVSATFVVELIKADEVESCGFQTLNQINTDKNGDQRSEKIDYQISNLADDVNVQAIRAKTVTSNKDCRLETYAEYMITTNDASTNYYSKWEEVRNNDIFETHFDEGYFNLHISQQTFIEKTAEIFSAIGAVDMSYTAKEVAVSFRFVTFNPANYTNYMYDQFTIYVKSSGEDKNTVCADYFNALSIDSTLPNIHYKVGSGDEEGWSLNKVLNLNVYGLNDLMEENPDCYDQLYLSLDA